MSLQCLIIEDQIPAQRIIQTYLEEFPEIKIAGICTNAIDALKIIRTKDIDLIFLDIHLPKLSGLDFLKNLKRPPAVIITSAYPEYALEGFELEVIDYLLKPFSFERFLKAVNRVLSSDIPTKEKQQEAEDFIFVRIDKVIRKVLLDKILFLQSHGDYVQIVFESEKVLLQQTLKYWVSLLPASGFMRIHKSYVINLSKLHEVIGNTVYVSGHAIPIGRSYKELLEKKLRYN